MYMDFRDFEASQKIVAELKNFMRVMPEADTHPRPYRAIMGDLTDFLFHIYHHTLGGRAIACDLDFVEVRDGQIAALIELKKHGRSMSPTQELVTGRISKVLNVPVYLVSANTGFTTFYVRKANTPKELRLDRRGFHEFMQDFEDPSMSLKELV
jgi:hypothetical protein